MSSAGRVAARCVWSLLILKPIRYLVKVMLLLAFVYCLDDNINQLTDVTWVILWKLKTLILSSSINMFSLQHTFPLGAWWRGQALQPDRIWASLQVRQWRRRDINNNHFRRSKVSDKSLKIFPGAKHQLFLELESTRNQVFSEIENWIERRMWPMTNYLIHSAA